MVVEDAVVPLWAHSEPGPRFTVAQAVERMKAPGEDSSALATRLRGFAQRGLVQVREKRGSGRTAHNLYAMGDLAATMVLSALTDLGIADNSIMQEASRGLYSRKSSQPKLGQVHPITAAIVGTSRGEWWIFHLTLFRGDQTGKLRVFTDLYPDTSGPTYPELEGEFLPIGTITVNLAPILQRVIGASGKGN